MTTNSLPTWPHRPHPILHTATATALDPHPRATTALDPAPAPTTAREHTWSAATDDAPSDVTTTVAPELPASPIATSVLDDRPPAAVLVRPASPQHLPPGPPTSADDRPAAPGADAERLARAGLSRVIEPGDPAALEAFVGLSAAETWELLQTGAPGLERWAGRLAETDPERDLQRAADAGARFVIPGDDEWPTQVEVLEHAGQQNRRGGVPFGLWVRGEADLRQSLETSVALVGARACSSYGEHAAAELAAGLSDKGVAVVSGGAYGIDAAAHRGALAGSGITLAVLACGVDVCYPKANTNLFDRIAAEGLLVSELPPGCSPTKLRFLARNRLIAASTLGTVVVEAAVRSGALNTAGWAEQCGRAVLAVPGPITSRMSEGVHVLVRERNGLLVTSVPDILEAIAPIGHQLTSYPQAPANPTDGFDLEVRRTLDAVPLLRPARPERIAATAALDLETVHECLETLAEADLVEHDEHGWRLSPTHRRSLGQP
ncbi:DNA protecting protein DprA [Kribbella amoyensis]|uniref:DNA protecting protein DprA n=1 Tax=Kribbella amoyensis TaxID=996641 RepID=A0A561B0U9_9ACTN|nr:DNA-processing protein DprA [Kribbella amoyensis]TWD72476.1 DNA protecting protein DprA [Kribbella amoyensis]